MTLLLVPMQVALFLGLTLTSLPATLGGAHRFIGDGAVDFAGSDRRRLSLAELRALVVGRFHVERCLCRCITCSEVG